MEVGVGIFPEEEILHLAGIVQGIVACHVVHVVASRLVQQLRMYLQRVRNVYCSTAAPEATAAHSIHYWGSL